MSKIKYDARPFVKDAPHWECLNWTSDKAGSTLKKSSEGMKSNLSKVEVNIGFL